MSEPTVSFSGAAVPSSPVPASVVFSLSLVVLLELELPLPPPHPATTIARAPTRSTAIKADSRILLDKPASDQKIAGRSRTYRGFRDLRLSTGPDRGVGRAPTGRGTLATLSEV